MAQSRRTQVGGTFARTGLPAAINSATYDAVNELNNWNGTPVAYDADGDMLSDGTHIYAWDARNHLSTIDSGSTGSFVYDVLGRRASKVISGVATSFLYDFVNPMQELSGTTPIANILSGSMDEYFSRTDSNGAANFLMDALGSTVALTDSTGSHKSQYTFDPYGNITQTGSSTSSSFTYTGREDDGTNLCYYRARYYNPTFGRFLSEAGRPPIWT